MSTIKERVAYLRGLMQGSGVGQNANEQQVWSELLGIMDQVGEKIDQLDTDHTELGEYLDAIDEDLADLENDVYDLDDEDLVTVECPHCNDLIYIDRNEILDNAEEDADYELICPNCNESFFVDEDDLETGCPCCDDEED